ncbi:MAG: hypothetical protein ACR2NM_00245, partial [Bythopirellula sp.]
MKPANANPEQPAAQPPASAQPPTTAPPVSAVPAAQPVSADDSFHDSAASHLPELRVSDLHFRPQRRVMLPILLFVATCVSTFWVGCTGWEPIEQEYLGTYSAMWRTIRINWPIGLKYMVAVLAILLTHEMGHFLQTIKNRITA